MTLKELKEFIVALPDEEDNLEVRFAHLNSGYSSEYEIHGYYKSKTADDKQLLVITDLNVVPRN